MGTCGPIIATLAAAAIVAGCGSSPAPRHPRPPAPAYRPPPLPPGVRGGRVRLLRFFSPALGHVEQAAVYLPAGYAAEARRGHRFPVLYLLHPPRGSPMDMLVKTALRYDADTLVARHVIHPMLLVVPYLRSDRFIDDTEWANAGAGRYEDAVLDTVRAVDARFATRADRGARGLAGVSEGGYGAVNIALHHLDVFSVAESWSGYFTQTATAAFHAATASAVTGNSPALYVAGLAPRLTRLGLRLWLYQGERDQVHPEVLSGFVAEAAAAGARVHWGYFRGGHGWGLWRRQGPRMLRAASAWFAHAPTAERPGTLVREGGRAAPWDSYYHYRGTPA